MKRLLSAFFIFALLFGSWHWMVVTGKWGRPAPLDVWNYLVEAWNNGSLEPALLVTTQRLLTGYMAGVLVGIPLGLLTARFQALDDTVGVIGLGFQTLPSVCWVPLAMLWFEPHVESAMLFVVVMGTLWSVALATNTGVRNVPPLFSRAARTMGSTGAHLWFRVIVPAALPVIIGGVKQGWAFAWRSLMAAEIYVTATGRSGLGHLLNVGRTDRNMAQVVGVMVVIMVVGLLADKILFGPWERFIRTRWGTK
jgi:NitT/TauT family transport system permease protein